MMTSEKASTSAQLTQATRIICRVCQKQFSQYTCPRCNSRYCSLQCYKAHSLRCTESFMQENVVEELQQLQADDETKRKMLDILKRLHTEEEIDDMDEDDSPLTEETVQKILSGNEVRLDELSAEEMKQLQRAVASGELSKMIQPWEPWWFKHSARMISLSPDGTQLVQPLHEQDVVKSSEDDSGSDQSTIIPPGPETPLPPMSKLSSTAPSPLLAVHLVDIIYSYCFTLRFYNGDWECDALGAAMVVLNVSSVLGEGGQPETVSQALSHSLEQTCSSAYRHAGGLSFGLCLLDDVVKLLSLGGAALVCLLCDLQRLIQAGQRELKAEKPRKQKRVEVGTKLKLAEKKIYFLMCWVHEQSEEFWSSLMAIVGVEKDLIASVGHEGSRVKADAKPEIKGKVLIEEDIDCMPLNPLENMPEALQKQSIAFDQFCENFHEHELSQSSDCKEGGYMKFASSEQENLNGPQCISSSSYPMNTLLEQGKVDTVSGISQAKAAASKIVNAQEATYTEPCTLAQIQAMSSLKAAGNDAFAKIGEALDSVNNLHFGADYGVPATGSFTSPDPFNINLVGSDLPTSCTSEPTTVVHPTGPKLNRGSEVNEALILLELILSCIAPLLMIQTCTE